VTGSATVARPPRIAVTLSDPGRTAEPELQRQKNEPYLRAVVRAGGDPAPLDTATPTAEREAALASMDGLLLSGGADLDPALYGETVGGATTVDPERDELDMAAWRAAGNRRVPVLGICRGFQAINVFMGGRLLQHTEGHRAPTLSPGPELHRLRISPGSRLARILRPSAARQGGLTDLVLTVNSYHHQGIRSGMLAPDLVASG
jgi:putative glutamine amidotransferase